MFLSEKLEPQTKKCPIFVTGILYLTFELIYTTWDNEV